MAKDKEPQDKIKAFRVNPYTLASMLQNGNKFEITEGIPDNSHLVGAGYDPNTNSFYLHIQNDKFKEVKFGELLPSLEVTVKDLNNENENKTQKEKDL